MVVEEIELREQMEAILLLILKPLLEAVVVVEITLEEWLVVVEVVLVVGIVVFLLAE